MLTAAAFIGHKRY